MKENAGVAPAWARSPGSGRNDRMCAAQKAWFAVTERKNVNPSWRAAYWSPFAAFWVWSMAQVAGWPQAGPRAVLTVLSRAGSLPMSCRYAAQLRPAADSWLPSVGTAAG